MNEQASKKKKENHKDDKIKEKTSNTKIYKSVDILSEIIKQTTKKYFI